MCGPENELLNLLPKDLINVILQYCGIFRPSNVLLAQEIKSESLQITVYPRKVCVLENKVEWKNKDEIGKDCELTNYKITQLRAIYDKHFTTPLQHEHHFNGLHFQRSGLGDGEFATFEEERLFDAYVMHHILLIDLKEMSVLLDVDYEDISGGGIYMNLIEYTSIDNFPILQVYLCLDDMTFDQCSHILSDIGYCNKTTKELKESEGNVIVNLKLQR
jgi:hypothetical protein